MKEIDTNKWGIIGHENIISYLNVSLANHKFAHAYLFAGSAHLGKKTVVNKFVQTLLCEDYISSNNESSVPCGECHSCKHLQKGIHPDYYRLELPDDKKNISIEQVREWQRRLYHKSFLTKYKIGLIVGAEHLSIGAANALLKTIEEPSGNTIIILITDDINLLLPTIISRSQVLKFNLVSDEKIYDYLQTQSLERHSMRDIAKLSFGLPGRAISYLKNLDQLESSRAEIREVIGLFSKPVHQRIVWLQNKFQKQDFISSQRIANEITDIFLVIARELLLYSKKSPNWYRLEFVGDELRQVAKDVSTTQIFDSIHKVYRWKSNMGQNVNPLLFTEDLLLNI